MGINVAALRRSHQLVIAETEKATEQALEDAAKFAPEHVRKFPRGYQHRTGNLAEKTTARVIRRPGGRGVIVKNTAKYAAAQDLGSKPHVIRARRRKFLAFKVGGRLVFARSVKHPGTKPTRFLYRATNAAFRVAGPNIERHMARFLVRRI